MMSKDAEKRPTIPQLLSEPCMQGAIADACCLARILKQDVLLPQLAHHTCLHTIESALGDAAIATQQPGSQSDRIESLQVGVDYQYSDRVV
jgi:hypothetical protein